MESTTDLSYRKLAKFAKKMHLKSGDILLVTQGSGIANPQTIDRILQVCDEMGLKNIAVLVVDNFDLKITNETYLNKHGWFHVNALSRSIHVAEDNDAVEDVSS